MKKLYYIIGIKGREVDIRKTLMDLGGRDTKFIPSDLGPGVLYYINEDEIIDIEPLESSLGRMILSYGEELKLPDPILTYEDLPNCLEGYDIQTIAKSLLPKTYFQFATSSQARSTWAASIISQVREFGKNTYGEIVPLGEEAYILILHLNSRGKVIISLTNSTQDKYRNSLLRFRTETKARLFLNNNRKLVEEYPETYG